MRLDFKDTHVMGISILFIAALASTIVFIYFAEDWGSEATTGTGSQVNKKSLKAELGYNGAVICLLAVLCFLHLKVIY
jgi:hypothetical protein